MVSLKFSDKQQSTIAVALTMVSGLVITLLILTLFWLMGRFLIRFSDVFLPLLVSAVVALVFMPYFHLLQRVCMNKAVPALILFFLSVLVPVSAFLWFFGAIVVEQGGNFFGKLPEWTSAVTVELGEKWPAVRELLDKHGLTEKIQEFISTRRDLIISGAGAFGQKALSAGAGTFSIAAGLLSWVIFPVYLAFFLLTPPMKTDNLGEYLPFLKPETRKDAVYLVNEFVSIVVAFFRGQILVAFGQGILFAIGFSLIGLKYGFVLGLTLGLLNLIPYLGSIIGLAIALPLALTQAGGGVNLLTLVVVVFTVVQMIEGYLLTPKIMGDRTGLHPMAIIIAIFFWGSALNGILGMILAIPLTAFLVIFWRLARDKYITEIV